MRRDFVLYAKTKRAIKYACYIIAFCFLLPVSIPAALLIRLLRPMILIRFGKLISGRIGHFAANTEKYVCEKEAGNYGTHVLDLFYCQLDTCNHQLKRMWKRQLLISPVFRPIHMASKLFAGDEKHTVKIPSDQNLHNYQNHRSPHLHFTDAEKVIGKNYLENKGVKIGEDRYVCFFSRDPKYLNAMHAYRSKEKWAYHDFRNADINSHIPAMEKLTAEMGYYAFRMGHLVEKKIQTNFTRIVDYATNGDRTELLDLYLCANCYFFLQSGGSGIASVARVFQRPIVSVNQIPLRWCHGNPVTVFIPKKLWLKEERRFMSFREILESEVGMLMKSEEYKDAGIEWIDNTANEIEALVIEADARLRGVWKPTEEDEILQGRFQALFNEDELCGSKRSSIGADFLRQNKELLK